jgi:hypothetical protein
VINGLEKGALKLIIDKVFPFDEIVDRSNSSRVGTSVP